MPYQYILIEKKSAEKLGIITLNRPEKGNRLNLQLLKEISAALKDLDADEDVMVIMVKGAGKDFCMGADVEELVNLDGISANEFFYALLDAQKTFRNITKPTIGVIQGYATAGGFVIALSCDLVVASEKARFGSTAINVGLFCFWGPTVHLPRIIGTKRAFELGMTGDLVDAVKAEQWGIINRVAPEDKLDEAATELAKKITSKSPLSILMGRRAFYACQDMEYAKGLEQGTAAMVMLMGTNDAKEGMRAFLEKRKPQWKMS